MKFLALCLVCALAIAGCGGGGSGSMSTSDNGRIAVTADWPDNASGIGAQIQSLVATIQSTSGGAQTAIVMNRPATAGLTRAVFDSLRPGPFILKVRALTERNGVGSQVSEVAQSLVVTGGSMREAALAMVGEIHEIVLPEQAHGIPLRVPTQVFGFAVDTSGRALLLPPRSLDWSVQSRGGAATITDNGVIVATVIGEIRVTLADPVSGTHAEVTLNIVTPPPTPPRP